MSDIPREQPTLILPLRPRRRRWTRSQLVLALRLSLAANLLLLAVVVMLAAVVALAA